MKRLISIIMAVILAVLPVTSCGNESSSNPDGNKDNTESSAGITEDTTPETELTHSLPQKDYAGTEFNMLVRAGKITHFFSEEYTGEPLNDAVYKRNLDVSEEFNVNFGFVKMEDNSATFNSAINQSVLSGDGAYDIVAPDYWWGSEMNGWFLNLNNLEYLNLDKPWWCNGWNNASEIEGVLVGAVGWFTLDMIQNMLVVFYNKDIYESNGFDDLYDIVRDNKWTIDLMNTFSTEASSDLNGDGKLDIKDTLGTVSALHAGRGLLWSTGLTLATRNENGALIPNLVTEQNYNIFKKVLTFYENTSNYYSTSDNLALAFSGNHSLFLLANIHSAVSLREMENDFGVVPFPMFDESQEGYRSFNLGCSYFSIPITANDPEMSSIILEALNFYSYKEVRPTYYDTIIKDKVSRDIATREMLDLAIDSCYIDPFFIYGSNLSYVADLPFSLIEQGHRDTYTSEMQKLEKSLNKRLEKLVEAITSAQ